MVSAIILAGGWATRLRPLSLTKPKPLFPVLGKPIIDYTLDALERAEIKDVYISLRVMADNIIKHVERGGRKVTFVVEEEPLGDLGPLKYISEKYPLDDEVLVIYGDVYMEVDFNEILSLHRSNECGATLMSAEVEDPQRYGVLYTEGDKLIQIVEKPSNPLSKQINAGVYVFDKKLFSMINGKSIARHFLPKVLQQSCVSVYRYQGVWADIGIPADYLKLNFDLLRRKYPRGFISDKAKVSEKAELTPPYFIMEDARVGEAYLDSNAILGRGSVVGNGSYVGESLLMDRVVVGENSFLKNVIVGDNSKIGKWNHIRERTILGEEVVTGDGVLLNRGTIILPYKEVSDPVYKEGKIIL
ncbi:sugar phosphate nucleotidyltransferase [Metallosphaera sedula]|uniref:sugar phosphate nucleotidyltransferase n=1 Tax=Metallosphaera sedula TaxID=43687 RepID=UPI0020BF7F1B|nr:NDP-sugar synthase [Metallosphaera sedula]BBL48039.1 mannose-1-phosphate guanylyltransferase [Metallosphaera sedula]